MRCMHCGQATLAETPWPKKCLSCQGFNYNSPKPVIVLVLPARDLETGVWGYLAVQRGINPFKGEWVFPGGYVDYQEDWQQAASREALEELGVSIPPEHFELVGGPVTTPSNFLLLFVTTKYISHDWTFHDVTKGLNDSGEQEVLAIKVFTDRENQKMGIPSHNDFWQNSPFFTGLR